MNILSKRTNTLATIFFGLSSLCAMDFTDKEDSERTTNNLTVTLSILNGNAYTTIEKEITDKGTHLKVTSNKPLEHPDFKHLIRQLCHVNKITEDAIHGSCKKHLPIVDEPAHQTPSIEQNDTPVQSPVVHKKSSSFYKWVIGASVSTVALAAFIAAIRWYKPTAGHRCYKEFY